MTGQSIGPHGFAQYLIPLIVFAVIFSLRARRMSQVRLLKLEWLWIVPSIYLVLVVVTFSTKPPSLTGWLAAAIALVVGTGVGWQRGRMTAITVDPDTHKLHQQGSPLAILFLFAIIAIKLLAERGGAAAGFDAGLVTDGALAFGLGMFTTTRIEMYWRGKSLLAAR
ncbi:MAG: DUF1453 family protein [Sphingomonas bacterium]|nr:DUF1453 family protein [Sphingomonas bacterium]